MSFTYYTSITIDAGAIGIGSNVSNFPFLVTEDLLDSGFFTASKTDGGDIRAYSDTNMTTEYPIEISKFNRSGEVAEIYVKIPTVSSSSDTTFYLMTGDASLSLYSAAATYGKYNVWTEWSYNVYHFADDYTNSASSNYTLTDFNSSFSSTALVYKSVFIGDNAVAYIYKAVGNMPRLTERTYQSVIRFGITGHNFEIFLWDKANGVNLEYDRVSGDNFRFIVGLERNSDSYDTYETAAIYHSDTWYNVTLTHDASVVRTDPKLYINGQEVSLTLYQSGTGSSYRYDSLDQYYFIGNNQLLRENLYVDETRADGSIKSADEILLENSNRTSITSNVTSDSTSITAVSITEQPTDQNAYYSENATFSVTATGSITSYQWYEDGVGALTGETSSTLTIYNVTASDNNRDFYVIVTGDGGDSDTSDTATLTTELANIYSQLLPGSTGFVGETSCLNISYTGPSNLAVYWYENDELISGYTGDQYCFVVDIADEGSVFTPVLVNSYGSETGTSSTFNAFWPVSITTNPVDKYYFSGESVTFTAGATGENLIFQWQKEI